MRLALMIIGLALAAIMGLQSYSVMTHPFAGEALFTAGGYGVLAAMIALVGAAFSLQYPVAGIAGYGLGALVAIIASLNSTFGDLAIWGAGLGVLAGVAAFNHFGAGLSVVMPDQWGRAASTTNEQRSATAAAAVRYGAPAPEADLFGQLERLGKLRSSGALNDEEFAAMKATLLKRHSPSGEAL